MDRRGGLTLRPAKPTRRRGRPTSAHARRQSASSGTPAASARTASDTFNRADGASLGTSDSGHVWAEAGTSGWAIASNTADPPNTAISFATLDLGAADVDMTVTFNPNFQSPDWGLVVKLLDANNLVFLDIVYVTDHWICRVFQRVAGTFTGNALSALVDPITVLGSDKVTPFTVRIRSVGQAGQVWVNDVSQTTWSSLVNTNVLTATKHGLGVLDAPATATFDSLTMTEV